MAILFRFLSPKLYDLIQTYRVKEDLQMPLVYQNIPGGRPLHDDWIMLKKTPRIETAYKIPLPFKQTKGNVLTEWMLYDGIYPLSPKTETKEIEIYINSEQEKSGRISKILTHFKVDTADLGFSAFAAYIKGQWRECFYQYKQVIFGYRILLYAGLKQDLTVVPMPDGSLKSDMMAWFPEISASLKKI